MDISFVDIKKTRDNPNNEKKVKLEYLPSGRGLPISASKLKVPTCICRTSNFEFKSIFFRDSSVEIIFCHLWESILFWKEPILLIEYQISYRFWFKIERIKKSEKSDDYYSLGHLTKESLFNPTESLNILNCIKYWYLSTQILRNSIEETLRAWFQPIDFIQCDWKMRKKFRYFQFARLMTSHSVLFELKINETIRIYWEFAYENFMTLPPLTQHHMIHSWF